jgi:hypothetical protein
MGLISRTNKRDVPYQPLLKVFVATRVAPEQRLADKRLQRTVGVYGAAP